MTAKEKKFGRFKDWKSLSSSSIEHNDSTSDGFHKRKVKSSASPVSDAPIKKLSCRINVLDPRANTSEMEQNFCNHKCDGNLPLFSYIPDIDDKRKWLDLDGTLQITANVLRTFFDLFYILHIIFQYRTKFVAPSSPVFGRGELAS